jgi:hypothetical protein
MNDLARQQPPGPGSGTREEVLWLALAGHREAYTRAVGTIEADLAAGQITTAQAQDAIRTARAAYTRDCDLAEIEADTGWHTWTGVGGVLYARREKSSPPWVVRAPSAQALREAIEQKEQP